MRKTKNIYNWLRTLSAILAICLMSNFATAQSVVYEPAPANEVSVWEWSGIQDFISWLTFQTTKMLPDRQKVTPQNTNHLEKSTKGYEETQRRSKPMSIVVKDMSVREPG